MAGAGAGKTERITFIRDLLGLPEGPIDRIRYQLLHRTAAAALEAARFKTDRAAMIVQSFSREHRWFEDFAAFIGLLGLEANRGMPLRHVMPSGKPLDLGWAAGSAAFL
jgi:hypothetical protein